MIRQREFLERNRHRIALLAVLGAISFAVVAAHSGFGHGEPMDDGMGEVVSMCLAVVDAVAAVGLGVALIALLGRVARASRELGAGPADFMLAPAPLLPSVRAGPPLLQVFRL